MVNWLAVCRPKEQGGLGITNSKLMNEALMLKWIWKIYQTEGTIWATIIHAKYTSNGNIFSSSDQGGSQFWKILHKMKHLFKAGAKHYVRNGMRTMFWLDWWQGEGNLMAWITRPLGKPQEEGMMQCSSSFPLITKLRLSDLVGLGEGLARCQRCR